jgi:hypothetical protein
LFWLFLREVLALCTGWLGLLVEMGSDELFCLGWPGTMIFLISISRVTRIIGMIHQCLATSPTFNSESTVIFFAVKSLWPKNPKPVRWDLWVDTEFSLLCFSAKIFSSKLKTVAPPYPQRIHSQTSLCVPETVGSMKYCMYYVFFYIVILLIKFNV